MSIEGPKSPVSAFVSLFSPDVPKRLAGDLKTLSEQFIPGEEVENSVGDAFKDTGAHAKDRLDAILKGVSLKIKK